MAYFKFNEGELNSFLYGPTSPIVKEVDRVTTAARLTWGGLMPRRSGRSAASLRKTVNRQGSRIVGRVYSRDPVVWYLEKGTGLYGPEHRIIRSRRGKMLGPISGPYPPFLRQTKGMRPQPSAERALRAVSPWPVTPGADA